MTQICGRACEAAGTSRFQGHSESTRSAFTLSQSTYLLWEAESRIWARVTLSVWEADLAVLELQLATEGRGGDSGEGALGMHWQVGCPQPKHLFNKNTFGDSWTNKNLTNGS